MGISGGKHTIYHISPVRLWLLVLAAVLRVAALFISDKAGQAGTVVLSIMFLSMAVDFSPGVRLGQVRRDAVPVLLQGRAEEQRRVIRCR